jgi:hypothetical protein
MFARQFLLQFFGIANGIPPGPASVGSHTQRMFTVLLAILMTGWLNTMRITLFGNTEYNNGITYTFQFCKVAFEFFPYIKLLRLHTVT